MGAREIGFTGGEPFMNPDMIEMTEAALSLGFEVLILTNAMRPMMRPKIRDALLSLNARYPGQLALRISFDHYDAKAHEAERGAGAFDLALAGVRWLSDNGLCFTIAGRGLAGENEDALRKGFAAFFAEHDIPLDASDPTQLIIFPEMDMDRDAPEITAACWRILDRNPEDMMCATSRMLIKRKGAAAPVLTSCTLLPYEAQFEMGASLAEAASPVKLNHPYCAQFCVLGGASCSN